MPRPPFSEMTPEQKANMQARMKASAERRAKLRQSRWMQVGPSPDGSAMRLAFSDGYSRAEIERMQDKFLEAQALAFAKIRAGKV